MINISLAYAPSPNHEEAQIDPDYLKQQYIEIEVPLGTTIYQAIESLGWLQRYSELYNWCEQIKSGNNNLSTKPNSRQWYVGVYSQKKPLDYILKNNDRVEIYRSLISDPMKRRKKRAKW